MYSARRIDLPPTPHAHHAQNVSVGGAARGISVHHVIAPAAKACGTELLKRAHEAPAIGIGYERCRSGEPRAHRR